MLNWESKTELKFAKHQYFSAWPYASNIEWSFTKWPPSVFANTKKKGWQATRHLTNFFRRNFWKRKCARIEIRRGARKLPFKVILKPFHWEKTNNNLEESSNTKKLIALLQIDIRFLDIKDILHLNLYNWSVIIDVYLTFVRIYQFHLISDLIGQEHYVSYKPRIFSTSLKKQAGDELGKT